MVTTRATAGRAKERAEQRVGDKAGISKHLAFTSDSGPSPAHSTFSEWDKAQRKYVEVERDLKMGSPSSQRMSNSEVGTLDLSFNICIMGVENEQNKQGQRPLGCEASLQASLGLALLPPSPICKNSAPFLLERSPLHAWGQPRGR